nr:hypothetical protein Itr_chr02CG05420 [Ipomoea trifida]
MFPGKHNKLRNIVFRDNFPQLLLNLVWNVCNNEKFSIERNSLVFYDNYYFALSVKQNCLGYVHFL